MKRMILAPVIETVKKHLVVGTSRDIIVLRITEEYITQVSEEIEGRVS